MPPTQERIKQNRNQNRLQRSLKQIKYAEKVCKWLVINEELEKATDDIEKIILIIQKSGKKVEKRSGRKLWFSTGFVECGKLLNRDV